MSGFTETGFTSTGLTVVSPSITGGRKINFGDIAAQESVNLGDAKG